jgi:hypothetical protein
MSSSNGPAEEGHRASALVQNGAHIGSRRVALDDEVLVEHRQLQNGHRRQSML